MPIHTPRGYEVVGNCYRLKGSKGEGKGNPPPLTVQEDQVPIAEKYKQLLSIW